MIKDFETLIRIISCSIASAYLGHLILNTLMNHYRNILYDGTIFPQDEMIKEIGDKEPLVKTKNITGLVGILERILYAGGWLSGYPQIIAVILALKIAPSLRGIKEKNDNKYSNSIKWTVFNMYLAGNFLSLILSIIFAEMLNWLWQLSFSHCSC